MEHIGQRRETTAYIFDLVKDTRHHVIVTSGSIPGRKVVTHFSSSCGLNSVPSPILVVSEGIGTSRKAVRYIGQEIQEETLHSVSPVPMPTNQGLRGGLISVTLHRTLKENDIRPSL